MGARFDSYQQSVDDRFLKLNAEMTLMKNKVDMMETKGKSGQAAHEMPRTAPKMATAVPSWTPSYGVESSVSSVTDQFSRMPTGGNAVQIGSFATNSL